MENKEKKVAEERNEIVEAKKPDGPVKRACKWVWNHKWHVVSAIGGAAAVLLGQKVFGSGYDEIGYEVTDIPDEPVEEPNEEAN